MRKEQQDTTAIARPPRPCPCGEMTIDDCAGECGKPARHPKDCEHPRCDLAF